MKLLNNMFMVEQYDAAGARFTIGLNAEHVIYRAHFPGHAVTPGVCIIQLLMELAEQRLQRPLRLRRVKNLKFISPLEPDQHPRVNIGFDKLQCADGEVILRGSISRDDAVFTKFSIIAETVGDS
ncbi:beta-hydroxyacyl-ACP dehydratase [Prevotella sp.]|uniref:beta-hydroxyacyl-ACP dehydratase n=1 Tax=Prevotella sp. TaxID=59823 RepID=UPI002F932A5D